MVSEEVKKIEKEVFAKLNEYFPKGGSPTDKKLRARALVILMMAKEMGVQGHADAVEQRLKQDKITGAYRD